MHTPGLALAAEQVQLFLEGQAVNIFDLNLNIFLIFHLSEGFAPGPPKYSIFKNRFMNNY